MHEKHWGKRIWTLGGLLLMVLLLFLFSGQDRTESDRLSLPLGEALLRLIEKIRPDRFNRPRWLLVNRLNWLVRKSAHVFLFGMIGGSLQLAVRAWFPSLKKRHRCAVTIAAMTMISFLSELHQRFVPGRTGQITDALIDLLGVALLMLGITLQHLIQMHRNRIR